jgi:uncharacterized protein
MTTLYEDYAEPTHLCGYASTFDATYHCGDAFHRIRPGAFDTTRYRVFAAFMHDHDRRLGWVGNKTLSLWQDSHGLAFQLDIPSTRAGLSF